MSVTETTMNQIQSITQTAKNTLNGTDSGICANVDEKMGIQTLYLPYDSLSFEGARDLIEDYA